MRTLALSSFLVLALGALGGAEETVPSGSALDEPDSPVEAPSPEPLHTLRYHYANDTFTSTDYYFTQGMGLHYLSPFLLDSPLAIPLPDLGPGSVREVSLRWRYEGYTPREIDRLPIQLGDRPFASYMTLGHRSQVHAAEGAASLWVEWSLGYLGPAVGAREFQAEVHRHTGGKTPRGWRNQIRGDLILQLEAGYLHRLLRHASLVDFSAEVELRGGTLFTDASLGVQVRFGLLGAPLGPPDFRLYLWGSLHARAVGFNATLEGGVFRDSDYTLSANDIERLVSIARIGASLEMRAFAFGFSLAFTSREFRGGRSHAWGQLSLAVFFH